MRLERINLLFGRCLYFASILTFVSCLMAVVMLLVGGASASAEGRNHKYWSSKLTIEEHIERMELENPDRVKWQMPEKIVDYLAIKKGYKVADIGTGSGYFTGLLSKKVGEDGKVYAVDIEKGMIEYIEKRVQKEGLNNIKTILSKPDDPLLSESDVDVIFICNTYFIIKKRVDYLKILINVLKKGGRLAIVDFQGVDFSIAPPLPPIEMRVSKEKTVEEVLKAGFKLEAEYYFLPYQYFLIFAKE